MRLRNKIHENDKRTLRFNSGNGLCDPCISWARTFGEGLRECLVPPIGKGRSIGSTAATTSSFFDEDGTVIGDYFADLLVDDRLVVEVKAAKHLAEEHTAQILGYLKSSRKEHGLLINFGSYKFQIKKYAMSLKD